jgi:hypothetical protein
MTDADISFAFTIIINERVYVVRKCNEFANTFAHVRFAYFTILSARPSRNSLNESTTKTLIYARNARLVTEMTTDCRSARRKRKQSARLFATCDERRGRGNLQASNETPNHGAVMR